MTPSALSLTASLSWLLAGVLLILASVSPWTSRGPLATSDLLETARVLRSGAVPAPSYAVGLVVTVPALGLFLAALSGLRHRVVAAVRTAALLLAFPVVGGVGWVATDGSPSHVGRGLLAAVAALALGIAALVLSRVPPRGARVVDLRGSA